MEFPLDIGCRTHKDKNTALLFWSLVDYAAVERCTCKCHTCPEVLEVPFAPSDGGGWGEVVICSRGARGGGNVREQWEKRGNSVCESPWLLIIANDHLALAWEALGWAPQEHFISFQPTSLIVTITIFKWRRKLGWTDWATRPRLHTQNDNFKILPEAIQPQTPVF